MAVPGQGGSGQRAGQTASGQTAAGQATGDQAAPLVLRVGESARVEAAEVRVTFVAVRGDSRCPKGVQCIRAGEARVALALAPGVGEAGELTVAVPPGGGALGAFRDLAVQVVALEPQTQAGTEIAAADYRLTLRVVRQ